jgi:ribulose-phosphate 3-epimerase
MKKLIAPSLLSADFSRLESQMREAESGGADLFHVDVMDGHFVPNLTFGPIIVSAIRKLTKLPLHVHLMIEEPLKYAADFVESGADYLSFHIEAVPDPTALAEKIRSLGAKPALALNPPTPLSGVRPFLSSVDLLLVMTVNPGFGGQGFMSEVLPKIAEARSARDSSGASFRIEVDGGITDETAPGAASQGADMFVAGSYVFGAPDIGAAIKRLRESVDRSP